jgi:hypothetical protein
VCRDTLESVVGQTGAGVGSTVGVFATGVSSVLRCSSKYCQDGLPLCGTGGMCSRAIPCLLVLPAAWRKGVVVTSGSNKNWGVLAEVKN